MNTTQVVSIGHRVRSLAENADIDLPRGLVGCGSVGVAGAWDQVLVTATRVYHRELLPNLGMWGAVVVAAGQWAEARDAALASATGTGHAPAVPDLATDGPWLSHPVFAGGTGAGLCWVPGSPGLGTFGDTCSTAAWFHRLADLAGDVAWRFEEQIAAFGEAWTGDLGAGLCQMGRRLCQPLRRFAELMALAQPAADLHRYAQTVEDIAQSAAQVREGQAEALAIMGAARSSLDDFARIERSTSLTTSQLEEQRRLLVRHGRAEDELSSLARTMDRLDEERRQADTAITQIAWRLADEIASLGVVPAAAPSAGGTTTGVKGTVVPAAYSTAAPVAASGTVEPYPDGLGPMGPARCPEWIESTPLPHDAGAGEFDSRPWTPADWANWWAAFLAATGAAFTGLPRAGNHLLHYLEGSGEDVILPVETMLAESASFLNDVVEYRKALVAQAIRLAGQSGATSAVTFPVRSEWRGFTFDSTDDRDWYLAVGSLNYAITGDITVYPPSPGSSEWIYTINYQVSVDDRYNWDAGKATPVAGTTIKDSDLAALHLAGFAQEFDMHGTSEMMTKTGVR
ncbi:hypothetical protein [Cellulomonas denverensis]|uniref:Uncharacterized protein n=1 Tax=Cellulomonas denverensis TaxID=264297 RepID=A0A7X6KW43_9CELL|nr:hypothetical protein [Cellulomonas denverensis]NKY23327.1 hypothetical protein [Cellulomonas denverensis]